MFVFLSIYSIASTGKHLVAVVVCDTLYKKRVLLLLRTRRTTLASGYTVARSLEIPITVASLVTWNQGLEIIHFTKRNA